MNPTWTILGTTAILSLCLVYVTRSGQQRARLDLERASLESERTTSALREQWAMAMQVGTDGRAMLAGFLEATQALQREHQESARQMMTAMTSAVSGIVSPPLPPPSPAEQAIAAALAKDPWDLTTAPAESRDRQEVGRMQSSPLGWTTGPVDPYAEGHLPDDVPGPIGESAQMVGAMVDDGLY